MVGGGRDALIGAVHRMAVRLDGRGRLVAGALSSTPDKALASGRDLGLPDDRNYPSWQAMLDAESALPPEERIEAVSIVTPNDSHHPIARAYVDAGFNVILDKPMVHASAQALDLIERVERAGVVLAVTYNYCGYPMVKQARQIVRSGELGEIRKVIVEYNQGWLASKLEQTGHKQASWRTDPARAGLGGAIADIGSHAEHLVSYVTGLEIESICADLTSFVPGRALDDDANLLIRFVGGARGVLIASQVCVGSRNDLRLRVWGDAAGLEWRQHEPDHLLLTSDSGPERVYRRGAQSLGPPASRATRLPPGHPEGFIEAFANVYRNTFDAVRAGAGPRSGPIHDHPDVYDGARGVHFIESAVRSAAEDQRWTDARWTDPRIG